MKMLVVSLLFGVTAVACAAESSDGRDDSFASDGKADESVDPESLEARGVVRLANSASKQELDDDVGLSARTTQNIVAYRAGDDGQLGTDDDKMIEDLEELDGIPYVGPISLGLLLDYAVANGYVLDACGVVEADVQTCLPEHAEGCFDIYEQEIQTCCYDQASASQACTDIREHLGEDACAVVETDFQSCLPEHAEGCFDIYEQEIQTCCYDQASTSQVCMDIRQHLGE
ncbi:MAG: hypothetical protein SFX73_25570 [Kofleriaceae bacterium]|nr:hypothetical protein [Kofleriaceae bacterium]